MIDIYYSKNNTPFVWASDLHQLLEIGTPLSTWFPRMIDYGFTENQDFNQTNKNVKLVQGGFNIKKDWAKASPLNKGLSLGYSFNLFSKITFNDKTHWLIKRNALATFGDFLPGYTKPSKNNKPEIYIHHEEPNLKNHV